MSVYLYDIKNRVIKMYQKDDVFDSLYFLEARVPTDDEIKQSKKNISQTEIKQTISKIDNKVPLYDVVTENMYLIKKENVYNRVYHQNYRFPEQLLLDDLLLKQKKYSKIKTSGNVETLLLRKITKVDLMISFLENFELDILYDTYVKVFYKYSKYGKEITLCKNASFVPQFLHVKPYLTKGEILNLALNFQIIKNEDTNIEIDENLCKKVLRHQMSSSMLLSHHNYIILHEKLGLTQYYTIQGSYFMNQYLRKMTSYNNKNEYLEKLIYPMWNLVLEAPEFDKDYYVYRFINNDSFLQGLNIGDVFTETGFMSTTRDPFYRSDLYKFGFILIKVKIPKEIKGIALCLETISHFPEELEIIFPPKTHFKLINKGEDCKYYHTDKNFTKQIKTRYEFEWIKNDPISFDRNIQPINTKRVDFLEITKTSSLSLIEKIKAFENNYVNEMYQFKTTIGDKEYTVVSEWYDSTGAYKNYYAIESKMGYSIYTLYNGYILFFIEIGETSNGNMMHINYFLKYSSVDPSKVVGDENLIKFFCSVANYFDVQTVVLYSNYLNCTIYNDMVQSGGDNGLIRQRSFGLPDKDTQLTADKKIGEINILGGSYPVDLYQYLTTGKKRYSDINLLNIELKPMFSYYYLDTLKTTSPKKILLKDDRDELYQIYDKIFLHEIENKDNDNIAYFYSWLKERKCYLLDYLSRKIDRLFGSHNPFTRDYYLLDAQTYLYNRRLISTYPININKDISIKRNILKENKNDYRINNE
jgi:hypothetical protein